MGRILLMFLALLLHGPPAQARPAPRTVTFYIAAEQLDWNYAPRGNQCADNASSEDLLWMGGGVGPSVKKAAYRQYTDATFEVQARATGARRGATLAACLLGPSASGYSPPGCPPPPSLGGRRSRSPSRPCLSIPAS